MFANLSNHISALRDQVYTERVWPYHERMIDRAFEHFIRNGSFRDVLDVGFGTGYTLNKFREIGANVTGITLDENELEEGHSSGHTVHLMDMNFLDFADNSFDIIWCRHSLEHSVMPLIALMEFNRVLRTNGHIYIEVPSDNIIHLENKNHYSLFSNSAWQMLFRKAGLTLLFHSQMAATVSASEQNDGYTDIYWFYWLRKQ